jgi:hypothetical protein
MEKMQQRMMKNYKMFAGLGLIIVLIAFAISLVAADANTTFFSVDKVTREAAGAGSNIVAANVTRHVIPNWVPSFKFVGLGLMLGAITMALGIIAITLRNLGINLMSNWPKELNPGAPEKPQAAKRFPMLMMIGWMILIISLIVALITNGEVVFYYGHSIANELNPAEPGSPLLSSFGLIKGIQPWLGALRFLGMAFLFTAITIALTVIIRTLQHQEKSLKMFIKGRLAASGK